MIFGDVKACERVQYCLKGGLPTSARVGPTIEFRFRGLDYRRGVFGDLPVKVGRIVQGLD